MRAGFVVLRFEDARGMMTVLSRISCLFMDKQMRLKMWSKEFDRHKEAFRTILVWIKLYNVPMEYWTSSRLGAIVRTTSKPLYPDEATSVASYLDFVPTVRCGREQ